MPVSEAARTFMQRRFPGRRYYIGLDSAIAAGQPAVIATSLLLVPVTLLVAIALEPLVLCAALDRPGDDPVHRRRHGADLPRQHRPLRHRWGDCYRRWVVHRYRSRRDVHDRGPGLRIREHDLGPPRSARSSTGRTRRPVNGLAPVRWVRSVSWSLSWCRWVWRWQCAPGRPPTRRRGRGQPRRHHHRHHGVLVGGARGVSAAASTEVRLPAELCVVHGRATTAEGVLRELSGAGSGPRVRPRRSRRCPGRAGSGVPGLPMPVPLAIPHTDASWVLRATLAAYVPQRPVQFGEMGSSDRTMVSARLVLMLAVDDPAAQVPLLGLGAESAAVTRPRGAGARRGHGPERSRGTPRGVARPLRARHSVGPPHDAHAGSGVGRRGVSAGRARSKVVPEGP